MKATRLFVQVRLIEELDLAPGKGARPYKAYRTLDRVDLLDVPTIKDGEAWLDTLYANVAGQLKEVGE